uniref:C-type lectin domain-containing protein n=1 Tax=Otus sunia TaxID=257818 RepID=A0A8C8ABR7_9STRI
MVIFCTALVILQRSTRSLDTAVTDKPDQVLFCFQGHKCIPCPENWIQYGENCYHFSKEWKTWQESKAQCSALESRLLKIESKEELSYGSSSFWIGLSRSGAEGPWLWEDGSAFSPDLLRYDPKSEIKTQMRSNAVYPKQVFIIKKVKRGSDRTEWKEKTERKQGCRIGLQE